MTGKYFKYLILLLFIFSGIKSQAQQTTGEWLGVKLELDLPRKFTFSISGDARILNNQINLYKYLTQFELAYKINKHFDFAASYRMAWRKELNSYFYYRDKIFIELNVDYSFNRFKFKDRIRYQRMTKTYINSDWDLLPAHHIRNKFAINYNIKNNKMTPGLYFELFFPVQDFRQRVMDEYRIGAEIKYPTAKKQSFTIGIMYDRELYLNTFSAVLFKFRYNFKIKI
jgi:hypothetical protein